MSVTFQTAAPTSRPCTVVALEALPLGPCRSVPDSAEPGASQAAGTGLVHAVRVSVVLLSGGVATEVDRFFSRFPWEGAHAYVRDNAAALDAAVAEAGADSFSFGLLDGVQIVS